MKITPVILAGGSGKRLWPLSRKSYPKQFASLVGDESLFQGSAKRLLSSDALDLEAPLVLTNADFRFIVTKQLAEAEIDPGPILIEPEGRNTAPAILAAAMHEYQRDPEAVLLVAPSDHAIPDTASFHDTLSQGFDVVQTGRIVTFGIVPTRPEVGYGYLELSSAPTEAILPLKSFVEKPNLETAQQYLASGNYLWNAGIFLFRAKDLLQAFETHAADLIAPVKAALERAEADLGFLRLEPEAWSTCKDISIDYAIMEKIDNLSVAPFSGGWSDLGQWDAVWNHLEPDEHGVVTEGAAHAIDCRNAMLRATDENQRLVGLGLDNILAIAMPDAVLIADMRSTSKVGEVVSLLKSEGIPQAETLPKDFRPWGWFESLVVGSRFQVKRIQVDPGGALSLQSHHHRSEHWIVVEGTAEVTIGDEVKLVSENQSVYIRLGEKHRLRNPGKMPMVLIEVQTGSYLGEDDIIRYDDVYSRK